jgi:hypothetical protein
MFGFRFKIILRPVQPFQTRTERRGQHLLLNSSICRWDSRQK